MRLRSLAIVCLTAVSAAAQNHPVERKFAVPAGRVQAALKKLPGGTSGPLPLLDGFVVPGTRSLDHFERPYFQCSVHVSPAPSNQVLVQVSAKITAWNSDPAHSGYEVLQSNGRIESDLLDRLQEALGPNAATGEAPLAAEPAPKAAASGAAIRKAEPPPDISAPVSQIPTWRDMLATKPLPRAATPPAAGDEGLQREAQGLEEIVRNQSHPTNLVAIKQEQTPVLQAARLDAPVLFLANAEDEFEVLNVDANWVYVRISGLSRGYLRRSSVQLLDDAGEQEPGKVAANAAQPPAAGTKPAQLFTVSGEEIANFPGTWSPLKGKTVKIISVQPAAGTPSTTSQEKLQFAETRFKQETSTAASAGVVVIFDSEDGGMIAATNELLTQWRAGTISDDSFLSKCYLDPPEMFSAVQ